MRVEFDNAVLEAKYDGLDFAPVFDRIAFDSVYRGYVVVAQRGGHRDGGGTIVPNIPFDVRYLNELLRKLDEQLWLYEHAGAFRLAHRALYFKMLGVHRISLPENRSPFRFEHADSLDEICMRAKTAVDRHGLIEFTPRPWYVREKGAE